MTDAQTGSMLPREQARKLATGLGWFSIGLGTMEVCAPGMLARWLGMRGSEPILQAYGVREIATGVGILASENGAGWLWGRVAGDGLDVATLAGGLNEDDANKTNIGVALAAVLGVTALDLLCARSLSHDERHEQRTRIERTRSYADRSGFPRAAQQMRGAARDFQIPPDMRTPALLRPLTSLRDAPTTAPAP